MKKKVLGVFLALFFALAIIGLIVFFVGFIESPEAMRLSPGSGAVKSVPDANARPEMSEQSSYLESLIEWFERN